MTFNQGVEIMVHLIQVLSALFLVYGALLAFCAAFGLSMPRGGTMAARESRECEGETVSS